MVFRNNIWALGGLIAHPHIYIYIYSYSYLFTVNWKSYVHTNTYKFNLYHRGNYSFFNVFSIFATPFSGEKKAGFHYQYYAWSFDQCPNILTGLPCFWPHPLQMPSSPGEPPTSSLGLLPPWIAPSVNTSSDTCRHCSYSVQIPTLHVDYTSVWMPPSSLRLESQSSALGHHTSLHPQRLLPLPT